MKEKNRAFVAISAIAICTFFLAVMVKAGLISEEKVTKTLVVVDEWSAIETHSLFFDHVRDRLGH